jgi:hypothetical protein
MRGGEVECLLLFYMPNRRRGRGYDSKKKREREREREDGSTSVEWRIGIPKGRRKITEEGRPDRQKKMVFNSLSPAAFRLPSWKKEGEEEETRDKQKKRKKRK